MGTAYSWDGGIRWRYSGLWWVADTVFNLRVHYFSRVIKLYSEVVRIERE